jgi:hypothetical protein
MTRPDRLDHPGDPLRHDRRNRIFYAAAVLVAAGAILQAVLGQWVAAGAIALVAGYLALHPYLRAGWYEAGYEAATPTIPIYNPGEGGGYVVFATEAVDGDPGRQAVMVASLGLHCRALLDVTGAYTDEWIIQTPLPPGARIVQADIAEHSVRQQ